MKTLEAKIQDCLALDIFNKDILKVLNLCSKDNSYNNVAAILADKNQFLGIDMYWYRKVWWKL